MSEGVHLELTEAVEVEDVEAFLCEGGVRRGELYRKERHTESVSPSAGEPRARDLSFSD